MIRTLRTIIFKNSAIIFKSLPRTIFLSTLDVWNICYSQVLLATSEGNKSTYELHSGYFGRLAHRSQAFGMYLRQH
jgi:hypothetical protein